MLCRFMFGLVGLQHHPIAFQCASVGACSTVSVYIICNTTETLLSDIYSLFSACTRLYSTVLYQFENTKLCLNADSNTAAHAIVVRIRFFFTHRHWNEKDTNRGVRGVFPLPPVLVPPSPPQGTLFLVGLPGREFYPRHPQH